MSDDFIQNMIDEATAKNMKVGTIERTEYESRKAGAQLNVFKYVRGWVVLREAKDDDRENDPDAFDRTNIYIVLEDKEAAEAAAARANEQAKFHETFRVIDVLFPVLKYQSAIK